ncbi:hypothetical protein ACFTZI_18625 [Streptomyces decoyicus]|uniref:hypothetical protein n=1 Tax=Streptomyces decoyicus TaxID=249567 RepID=UPI003627985C
MSSTNSTSVVLVDAYAVASRAGVGVDEPRLRRRPRTEHGGGKAAGLRGALGLAGCALVPAGTAWGRRAAG